MRPPREQCDDCVVARGSCANHIACRTQRDARTAADIGIGWAIFVHGQIDTRRPWPPFAGRCAAIASRLVAWLSDDEARREQLARICVWRAGLRWELIATRHRDRPYEAPSGKGVVYELPGYAGVCIRFRPRASGVTLAASVGPRFGVRAAAGSGRFELGSAARTGRP